MDVNKIEQAVAMLLQAIGEDVNRSGIKDTPARVARMYADIFSGIGADPWAELFVEFDEQHDELVMIKDISFYSMCEHHLLPFFGRAHIAYIPRGKLTGLSKLARAVDILAMRPQTQERLTSQIANVLCDRLQPRGVAVVIEAEHLCMSMRGVKKPGALTVTSAVRGLFRENTASRAEVLSLLKNTNR